MLDMGSLNKMFRVPIEEPRSGDEESRMIEQIEKS